ncbi:hypothetical protein scyTo_0018226, partial [Scyliorhinus torazame]|nr:hypothetical protein [Scyliorhinus torazame]
IKNTCPCLAQPGTTIFNDDDEQSDEFLKFRVTSEEKMMLDLLKYAKGIPSDAINKLDIEEVLNIDNEALVFHSMTDGEIAGMFLNQGDHDDKSEDEDDIVNTKVKVSLDVMVKMCNGRIEGIEGRAFITEQEKSCLIIK